MNILTTPYIERIRIGGVYIYLLNAALALWAGQCRANSKLWAHPSVRAISDPSRRKGLSMKCFVLCAVVCLATGKRAASGRGANQNTQTHTCSGSLLEIIFARSIIFAFSSRCLDGRQRIRSDRLNRSCMIAFVLYQWMAL